MKATLVLDTLGSVAVSLQKPAGDILAAAVELRIVPAALINGAPYYDAQQQDLLRDHFQPEKEK